MRRSILVGDVHSCSLELGALLDAAAFDPASDRLVLLGDVLVRGPDPLGTLELMRQAGAVCVRGNHENKVLSLRGAGDAGRAGSEHQRVAALLRDEDWAVLEAMPLWLDLPEHGVLAVHAGVVPGTALERTPPEVLMTIRTLDGSGRYSDKQAGELWGARYEGPPHVVFGHNARPEVQLHPWATGIDTGCVYGGRLTAVVLPEGEAMPRGDSAREALVSVPARKAYYGD